MSLSAQEREIARGLLTESRAKLHGLLDDLTAEQWHFRAGEAWSIALILEHVYLIEAGSLKIVSAAPPSAETDLAKDARIMTFVVDRSSKRQAPERVVPQGRTTDPAELLGKFDAARDRSLAWLDDPDVDHRAHAMDHHVLKMLDGYQWLLFYTQHLLRHVAQMEEVIGLPEFPKTATGPAAASVPE